ncbi:DUF2062 domain-containing protein [Ectothiorhodospiraceae bacterium WFHF3C12]|nr:DUF2062 domain-containing protein [Ectothiorhodospiraceae bacterium WFHF3C12]
MPRKFLKRLLPRPERVRDHRQLRWLGQLLDDPFLLHLNRRSVAGGVAVGLFTAFLPVPIQMAIAALAAIAFRVNIIIAVMLVWISNPITIPPMFYFTYTVGTWILGAPMHPVAFEPTLSWFWEKFGEIWQPLLLGSVLIGAVVSFAGYGLAHLLWRMHVVRHWHRRRLARARRRRIEKTSTRPEASARQRRDRG